MTFGALIIWQVVYVVIMQIVNPSTVLLAGPSCRAPF